jgi:putative membrane protein
MSTRSSTHPHRLVLTLLALTVLLLIWSGIRPHDYPTWALEVFPAVAGIIACAVTYRRFPLTPLTYILIFIHLAILIIGGHYTYAEVPLGNWFKETFELSRNHYDRLGHLAQGFIPAIITREVLIRNHVIAKRGWLSFIVVSICTAISGVYELVEWAVSISTADGSSAFLGTQGDVWDTQKDIALCLVGAIVALPTLSRLHDRQLARYLDATLSTPRPPAP